MGHHFVPQRYLRNFEDPNQSGHIWVYDRRGGPATLANIAKVAQSRKFYSPETEKALAESVERPASPVIQKLISKQPISNSERFRLGYYIGVMMRRIPAHRRRSSEMFPEVLNLVVTNFRTQINDLTEIQGADREILARRMAELDTVDLKFRTRIPVEVQTQIQEPWPSDMIVNILIRMTWRILKSGGPDYFVTTDDPACILSGFGLGREESELCFPLSSKYVLHGSWQGVAGGLFFIRAQQSTVREINRRLVAGTERLVFYHRRAAWISRLLRGTKPFLSRIRWK